MSKLYELTDKLGPSDGDLEVIDAISKSPIADIASIVIGQGDVMVLDNNVGVMEHELTGFKLLAQDLSVDGFYLGNVYLGNIMGTPTLALAWDDEGVYFLVPKEFKNQSKSDFKVNKLSSKDEEVVMGMQDQAQSLGLARAMYPGLSNYAYLEDIDSAASDLGVNPTTIKLELVHGGMLVDENAVGKLSDYSVLKYREVPGLGVICISSDRQYLGHHTPNGWFIWKIKKGLIAESLVRRKNITKAVIAATKSIVEEQTYKQLLAEKNLSRVLETVKSASEFTFFRISDVARSEVGEKQPYKEGWENMLGNWYDTVPELLTAKGLPVKIQDPQWVKVVDTEALNTGYILIQDKLIVFIEEGNLQSVLCFNCK